PTATVICSRAPMMEASWRQARRRYGVQSANHPKMRAARREWLVLAGPSQGRAQYAHHRSTNQSRATGGAEPGQASRLSGAGAASSQVIERGIEPRLRCLRHFLGARPPRLFVLELLRTRSTAGVLDCT